LKIGELSRVECFSIMAHPASHSSSSHEHTHTHGDLSQSHPHKEVVEEAEHFIDVIRAYRHYATHALQAFHAMEADFRRMPAAMQTLISAYLARLKLIRKAVNVNHVFITAMLKIQHVFKTSSEIVSC